MRVNVNMPFTASFDPRHGPLQVIDLQANKSVSLDAEAEESSSEEHLIRLWYFPDSLVD